MAVGFPDGPAFQLIEDKYAESGAYGVAAYGTGRYGGEDYPEVYLPALSAGSDDLAKSNHKSRATMTVSREGVIIGARKWTTRRKWNVKLQHIEQDDLDDLITFWNAERFRMLPNGGGGQIVNVRWVDGEFKPTDLRGGYFNLELNLEETS